MRSACGSRSVLMRHRSGIVRQILCSRNRCLLLCTGHPCISACFLRMKMQRTCPFITMDRTTRSKMSRPRALRIKRLITPVSPRPMARMVALARRKSTSLVNRDLLTTSCSMRLRECISTYSISTRWMILFRATRVTFMLNSRMPMVMG